MAFDTANPIIKRSGKAAVTYDLSVPYQTTITLPAGSTWTSGLHWHETHDEYLRVLSGSIKVRLGQEILILLAGQEAKVPKHVRHEWSRAEASDDEDVIVIERTEPRDEEKHLFFWNLNGVILTADGAGIFADLSITLRLFLIFAALDNWPVFWELSSYRWLVGDAATAFLEWMMTHAVLFLATILGKIVGFEAVDSRLTPSPLLQAWKQKHHAVKKST